MSSIFSIPLFSRLHGFPRILPGALCLLASPLFSSCFTGIEGTRKIEVTKTDRRMLQPSEEEKLMAQVCGVPLRDWPVGKVFIVADERLALIARAEGSDRQLLPGMRFIYEGETSVRMPDGREYARLSFTDGDGGSWTLDSGKLIAAAPDEVLSDRLPMLIDAEMAARADSLLRGRELWSKTHIIYDSADVRLDTLKFIPFRIDSVSPGRGFFPLRVWTHTLQGSPRFFYIDFNYSSAESRPMGKIFSLSDPRRRYPHISDDTWELIRARRVRQGMTKEECRLSLGSPSDASSGRDYNSTLDLWQYSDGTYLRFVDGLLESFRL